VHDDQPVGLFDGFNNTLFIQWAKRTRVHHLHADPVCGKLFGSAQRAMDHFGRGHDGDVLALALDIDLAKIADPLEHMAWRWLKYWTYWHDNARKRPGSSPEIERLIKYIEDYNIDGVVMHEAFSCRTWHVGLIWQLNQLKKIYRDIPSLVLESDIIDISSYNEADTRARIDAFIDTLEAAKNRG